MLSELIIYHNCKLKNIDWEYNLFSDLDFI